MTARPKTLRPEPSLVVGGGGGGGGGGGAIGTGVTTGTGATPAFSGGSIASGARWRSTSATCLVTAPPGNRTTIVWSPASRGTGLPRAATLSGPPSTCRLAGVTVPFTVI